MDRGRAAAGLGSALLVTLAAVASAGVSPPISVTKPVPGVVHERDVVTVSGVARRMPRGTRAVLELMPSGGGWAIVARASIATSGAFRLRWTVRRHGYAFAKWRVAAARHGTLLGHTTARTVVIGPANVACKPPPPPNGPLPAGDGWVVGGLYGEGGPAGAPTRCSSQAYTIEATDGQGHVTASRHVAAMNSYRLALPAGSYNLSSGSICTSDGAVSVVVGKQITANAYCRYP